MKAGSPYRRRHSRIEIIPLIDIMFFLLASFMLANQGHEDFFFSGHKSDNGNSWYGDDKIVLGSPSGSLKSTSGGAYYRAYSKGMVVVNPTGGSLSVPLGAAYHLAGGAAVSTVKVAAHTGMFLTS